MLGQIIGVSLYLGIAFGAAVALVLGMGVALHTGSTLRRETVPYVFYAIILAVMAAPIATERVLSAGLAQAEASFDELVGSFWISRILTLLVLALCAERMLRFLVRREWKVTHGWPLCLAFLGYAFSNHLLNGMLGSHPAFDHKALYALLVVPAIFVVGQIEPDRCFRFARNALFMFFAASALCALAKPAMVIEFGYSAGLPGVSFRYYGLATHANTIGPLAIALMICLWRFPFGSRLFNLGAWGLVSVSLILSQSKTSIAIAGVIGGFLLLYGYWRSIDRTRPGANLNAVLAILAGTFVGLAVLSVLAFAASDWIVRAVDKWDATTGGHLSTLTGRTRIWALAWHEFTSHPAFGYGPTIWGPIYRIQQGLLFAAHAHNQYLQSLSAAGIIGFVTLLAYLSVLIVYAMRSRVASSGVSLALAGLLLLRTVTEVPFSVGAVMQSEFFIHMLLIIACVGYSSRHVKRGNVLHSRINSVSAPLVPGMQSARVVRSVV